MQESPRTMSQFQMRSSHTYNSRTQEAQTGGIQNQPRLHGELQVTLDYLVSSCLKPPKQINKIKIWKTASNRL